MQRQSNRGLFRAMGSWPYISLTLLGLGTLSFSCGNSEKSIDSRDEKPLTQRLQNDRRPYQNYFLQDSGCQNDSDTTTINSGTVHRWTDAGLDQLDVSFKGLLSGESMSSSYITGTTYGAQYSRTCDFEKPEGARCRDFNGEEISWTGFAGQGLKLCRPHADYPRRSYEGVATASAHYIHDAAAAYSSAIGQAPKPIELWVLPTFKESYQNYRGTDGKEYILDVFIVNNLAYFPGQTAIAVFPEKHSSPKELEGAFWESPFVLAHEFGHHVESLHTPAEAKNLMLQWDPIRHSYQSLTMPEKGVTAVLSQNTRLEKVRGSLSEGFADLIAYYSVQGDRSSIKGLPCGLKCNRDIVEAEFYGGEDKILTETTVDYLFGLQQHAACNQKGYEPCLAEIHNVGAIFSHSLNRIAARLTAAKDGIEPGSPEDFKSRYALLVHWYQETIRSMATTDFSLVERSADYFASVVDGIEAMTDKAVTQFSLYPDDSGAQAQLRREICEYASEDFAALTRVPFTTNGECI